MKIYKYYTVYKITNTINDKIYIGAHSTDNLDDSYKGSGLHLKRAQQKYGVEHFTKNILHIFDNESDMFRVEKLLVNEGFVNSTSTYNLKEGGKNWTYETARRGYDIAVKRGLHEKSTKACTELRKDKKYVRNWMEKTAKTKMDRYGTLGSNSFTGKKHTDEAKRKIGEANSVHQSGEGNSQFGTIWIYNLELRENKKISNTEDIPLGWQAGGVRDFDKHFDKINKKQEKIDKRKEMIKLFIKIKDDNGYDSIRELHDHLIGCDMYSHSAEALRRFINKHK